MTDNSRSSPAVLAALPWTARLRALGYKGAFEAGAMLRALASEIKVDVCRYELTLGRNLDGAGQKDWSARYAWFEDVEYPFEGETPEEALGNLMLAHPELWKK